MPLLLTAALELVRRRGEYELVPELVRGGAPGDPRLDVVALDPGRQPAEGAVAVERVGAERAGKLEVCTLQK